MKGINRVQIKKWGLVILAIIVVLLVLLLVAHAKANTVSEDNIVIQAAEKNNLPGVYIYSLLVKEANRTEVLSRALIASAEGGHKNASSILYKRGADPNYIYEDATPFLAAIESHSFSIASMLLNSSDVNMKINDRPYLFILAAQNNAEGCAFLLSCDEIDLSVREASLTLVEYLWQLEDLSLATAQVFAEQMPDDELVREIFNSRYDILEFGGAFGIAFEDDVLSYALFTHGDDGKDIVYLLFDAERFDETLLQVDTADNCYVTFAYAAGKEEISYVRGIAYQREQDTDVYIAAAGAAEAYLMQNSARLFAGNIGAVKTHLTLGFMLSAKRYQIDDMFALNDEAFSILLQPYVNVSGVIPAGYNEDIVCMTYTDQEEKAEALEAALFALRAIPLSVSGGIDNVYLTRRCWMRHSNVELNGVYTNETDIVLAKSVSASIMIDTYLHEFSHFVTRAESSRALIEKLTAEASGQGYFDTCEAESFYGVAVYGEDGGKRSFYEVYEQLMDYDQDTLRAEGFVDSYALKDSWEDFATTAEALFAYHYRGAFVEDALESGYDVLAQKCNAVMQTYNEYARMCEAAPFMDEDYFARLRHFRAVYGYTNSLIQ